mmetsp:Transcript_8410/g.15851  ORF Transcript_8410/g.15851 Transcript_8410/m.15851 type:complete len:114 (-) Transcript_8410:531-872(-)
MRIVLFHKTQPTLLPNYNQHQPKSPHSIFHQRIWSDMCLIPRLSLTAHSQAPRCLRARFLYPPALLRASDATPELPSHGANSALGTTSPKSGSNMFTMPRQLATPQLHVRSSL